ncbi:MAG: hypothetical protein ACI9XO_002910 [Paraglaciecola sp.]|jgi:hypothetical protein
MLVVSTSYYSQIVAAAAEATTLAACTAILSTEKLEGQPYPLLQEVKEEAKAARAKNKTVDFNIRFFMTLGFYVISKTSNF